MSNKIEDKADKIERPALGEWCEVLSECHGYTRNDIRKWTAIREMPGIGDIKPVRGMYMGFRIVFEGTVKRDNGYDYDTGTEYAWLTNIKSIEVWLFVLKANHEPIRAFPRHVRRNRLDNLLEEVHGVE